MRNSPRRWCIHAPSAPTFSNQQILDLVLRTVDILWRTERSTRSWAMAAPRPRLTPEISVVVVVDRLGYGASSKVPGNAICVGSRADIAHQMVVDLRDGHYTVAEAKATHFSTVVLAGRSYGAQIAQVEAYSFGGIDFFRWHRRTRPHRVLRPCAVSCRGSVAGLREHHLQDRRGRRERRQPAVPYAFRIAEQREDGAVRRHRWFADTAPAVLKAALPTISIDPCGDDASFAAAVKVDLANVAKIRVRRCSSSRVARTRSFPPPAGADQASLLTGSTSVTVATVPGSGHAITPSRHHAVPNTAVDTLLRSKIHVG